MKRTLRKQLAEQTLEILARGSYHAADHSEVNIARQLADCLEQTRLYEPAELEALKQQALSQVARYVTTVEVANETTLAGITHLQHADNGRIAVLNFASAKNPGGGFLNGSEAQEESLARSSALYASQQRAFAFYERHRTLTSCLYTDAMIFSPDCPIMRDNEGELLAQPLAASFITSAAPNAGAIAANAPEELPQIPSVLRQRAEYVLALAAARDCESLVLGAWGCGVFRNDPALVAETFAALLRGAWSGRFRQVRFSVLDHSPQQGTYAAFAAQFDR